MGHVLFMWDPYTIQVGPAYHSGGTVHGVLRTFLVGPTWDHRSIECVSLSFSKNYVPSIIWKHKIYLIIFIYKRNK